MNCDKIESVTSHELYPPPPCHKLSHFLRPPPPWSVTYFMDGPFSRNFNIDRNHELQCWTSYEQSKKRIDSGVRWHMHDWFSSLAVLASGKDIFSTFSTFEWLRSNKLQTLLFWKKAMLEHAILFSLILLYVYNQFLFGRWHTETNWWHLVPRHYFNTYLTLDLYDN